MLCPFLECKPKAKLLFCILYHFSTSSIITCFCCEREKVLNYNCQNFFYNVQINPLNAKFIFLFDKFRNLSSLFILMSCTATLLFFLIIVFLNDGNGKVLSVLPFQFSQNKIKVYRSRIKIKHYAVMQALMIFFKFLICNFNNILL